MKPVAKRILFALIMLAAAATLFLLRSPAQMASLIDRVRGMGATGAVVYAVIYILGTPLMLPATLLTLGAGFLYGPVYGTILSSVSSVTGAAIAFYLARSLLHGWVAARMAAYKRWASIDRAVQKQGFKMVLLLRMQPVSIPFAVMNYAIGLTGVRWRDYLLASWLGMLPGTFFHAYIGSALDSVSQMWRAGAAGAGPAGRALFWIGLAAALLLVWFLSRVTRDAINAQPDVASPSGVTETPAKRESG